MKLPNTKTPCKECPFRKGTLRGWLESSRMAELLNYTVFTCHKTTYKKQEDLVQCAGHMLLKGAGNDFVQLSVRLGLPTGLRGKGLVFDTEKDCIKHHDIGK